MKKHITLCLVFVCHIALSQTDNLRDYQWVLGTLDDNSSITGGIHFNFLQNPVAIEHDIISLNFAATNASICSTDGELLFYSNGLQIINRFGDTLATGLNPGMYADYLQGLGDGYSLANGAFVLPDPGNENRYYLFHEAIDYYEPKETFTSFWFYYTLIDMTAPDGTVISQNNLIVYDTLDAGHTTAVRHGNGRDWWILKAQFDSNQFYAFLLTPEGIQLDHIQTIGAKINGSGGLGQAVFSPDGSKYARNDASLVPPPHAIKLYDFDRCTGLLSNMQEIVMPDSADTWSSGMAFSPDSRYLYAGLTHAVYQYDTEADDVAASAQLVAEWDGQYAPYPFESNFYMMQLAPDNKIYINSLSPTYTMHIIHTPNAYGSACNFEMGVFLPAFNRTLPHFPHYRLYAQAGSPCDTLGITGTAEQNSTTAVVLSVFPNPVEHGELVNVIFNREIQHKTTLSLYTLTGQKVLSIPIEKVQGHFSIAFQAPDAPGLYLLKWESNFPDNTTVKLLIQ